MEPDAKKKKKKKPQKIGYKKVATVLRLMPVLVFQMFPSHCEKITRVY